MARIRADSMTGEIIASTTAVWVVELEDPALRQLPLPK